jgi:serine/threonine-protein kinase HipA
VSTTEVEVHVESAGATMRAGTLYAHRRRTGESATFTYDSSWLARPDAYALDPELPLVLGPLQTSATSPMFGACMDSAPDRWGRTLVERAERRRSRRDASTERSLGEIDYLLGVGDDVRGGALRYRASSDEPWLAASDTGVPALVDLPRLLDAAASVERDEPMDETFELLLRGGSSLGGARPKAHVVDAAGAISIAKFPSVHDPGWDVVAWELVVLELARGSGIEVPAARLERVGTRSVLLIDRFDRSMAGRIGYVSAMTMLETTDGDRRSWIDLAEMVEETSVRVVDDLHELWRRAAFGLLVSNADDHLRNHGLLRRADAGWHLSPAFDLNADPTPQGRVHATTIDGSGDDSIGLLLEVAEWFRLKPETARRTLGEVERATGRWRETARRTGIATEELSRLESAFEHRHRVDARGITKR